MAARTTEPKDYWLSNMDLNTPLKTGLGLDHFAGRSFTGWHPYVTVVCLAQAFCTLLRLHPQADAPA